MKLIRLIPLAIGWLLLGASVMIFCGACGIGWLGEQIMKMAFNEAET